MISPHTPGPWRNGWGKVTDSDGKAICMIVHRKNGDNGNLIASAPEMLQALESIVEAYQRYFDIMPVAWQSYDDHARAIISKAKGSQ